MKENSQSNVQSCPILAQSKAGKKNPTKLKKVFREILKDIWNFLNASSSSFVPGAELIVRVVVIGLSAFCATVFATIISASSNPSLVLALTDIMEASRDGLVVALIGWLFIYVAKGIEKKLRENTSCDTFDQLLPIYIFTLFLVAFILCVPVILLKFTPTAMTKIECATMYTEMKGSAPDMLNGKHSVCVDVPVRKNIEGLMNLIEERAINRKIFKSDPKVK